VLIKDTVNGSNYDKYDLTRGGIAAKLLQVALPIMGMQFTQMAYNLTDMFWLGRLGSDAVAATGAAGMYLWLSFGFLLVGRMGAEIGVAQSLGRGDKREALAYSQNSLVLGLFLGVLFGMVMLLFPERLAGFFNFKEGVVARDCAVYIFTVAPAMPLTFVSGVIMGTFTACGNSRTPFILNGAGLALNMVLDPALILGAGMGVRGAALATAASQALVALLLLTGICRFKNRPFGSYFFRFGIDKQKLRRILAWSVPVALESIFFCFLSMVTSRIEASFGAQAVAAGKLGSQLESLTWLIGGGFCSALISFTGQNYGAGKTDRVRRGVRFSVAFMGVWGTMVSLLLFFAGKTIFRIFLPDPEMVALGASYLRIFAFCQLAMCLEGTASGAFKGMGKTIPPSVVSIVTNLTRPVLALILSRTGLGIYGVWIAVTITANVRGIWICLWYYFWGGKLPALRPVSGKQKARE
jgi:putative MATE family efflux protein